MNRDLLKQNRSLKGELLKLLNGKSLIRLMLKERNVNLKHNSTSSRSGSVSSSGSVSGSGIVLLSSEW